MPRMLIVEDELDLGGCLRDFFQSRGFSVRTTFSGEEALERFEDQPADVVLLDIILPGLSGLEVLRRIKTSHPSAKVVMVTALDQDDVRKAARMDGADGYITKPFDFSEDTWRPVFATPT